jgi:hypothetical protein
MVRAEPAKRLYFFDINLLNQINTRAGDGNQKMQVYRLSQYRRQSHPDGRHVVSGYEDLIRAVDGASRKRPVNQSANSLWAEFPGIGTESIGFALRDTRSEQQVIEQNGTLKLQLAETKVPTDR